LLASKNNSWVLMRCLPGWELAFINSGICDLLLLVQYIYKILDVSIVETFFFILLWFSLHRSGCMYDPNSISTYLYIEQSVMVAQKD
jgi:hypothetical protein